MCCRSRLGPIGTFLGKIFAARKQKKKQKNTTEQMFRRKMFAVESKMIAKKKRVHRRVIWHRSIKENKAKSCASMVFNIMFHYLE